jgi:hypothetical protein|nr:MAG TPA: hypothetical protein [Caudoviricetes sp.]
MVLNSLMYVELFVFILSFLEVFREIFGVIKVIKMRSGKVDITGWRLTFLGFSISYILTMIILGF